MCCERWPATRGPTPPSTILPRGATRSCASSMSGKKDPRSGAGVARGPRTRIVVFVVEVRATDGIALCAAGGSADATGGAELMPAPLRVLHVGKFYPPAPGGMEKMVQSLCEGER